MKMTKKPMVKKPAASKPMGKPSTPMYQTGGKKMK